MTTGKITYEKKAGEDAAGWEEAILKAVRGLRYGSVEIVVHDGRVVEVSERRRTRFQNNGPET
jgi:hypothetical protein